MHALEGHVATLKAELEHRAAEIDALRAQLASAEARASDEAAKTGQAIAAVEAHNATLKADIEKIETLLAAERQRADKAIAAFESLAQRLKRWRPSRPSSRGGSGFSEAPDEASQPSGQTGGG